MVRGQETLMEINNTLQKLVNPYSSKLQGTAQQAQNRAGQAETPVPQGDRVSVSPEAKLFATAQSAVAAAPEIRQERVSALKEQVQNGTYEISSRTIASRLLQSDAELSGTLKG